METDYRVATLGMTEEMRRMDVGETVKFPVPQYNYNSLRAAPASLFSEQCEGKAWKTRKDFANKCVWVTRVS